MARPDVSFPAEMLAELKREAARTGQPLSTLVQVAWEFAKAEIKKFEPAPKKRRKRAKPRWPRWTE